MSANKSARTQHKGGKKNRKWRRNYKVNGNELGFTHYMADPGKFTNRRRVHVHLVKPGVTRRVEILMSRIKERAMLRREANLAARREANAEKAFLHTQFRTAQRMQAAENIYPLR